MNRPKAALAVWVALVSSASAQTFPMDTLWYHGPANDRINLVFLAEGYTAGEMAAFRSDALNALAGIAATEPFGQYQSFFNVYAVEVPSNESGTDHPGTAQDEPGGLPVFFRDTYFNSTFDGSDIHRLLVANNAIVSDVLFDNFPAWDAAFVVVNSTMYGGSGGDYATFSVHSAAPEIAVHELGHAYMGLADEYDYCCGSGHEAPNATSQTQRNLIRWTSWIDSLTPVPTPESFTWASEVGLFEGAVYNATGWYRPKLDCKMKSLGIPFCEVCRQQAVLIGYDLLGPVEAVGPESAAVSIPFDSTAQFTVSPRTVLPNTFEVIWSVDGNPVESGNSFLFEAVGYDSGLHAVTTAVRDTTPWVRDDLSGKLTYARAWSAYVQPRPYYVGDVNGDRKFTSADVILLVNYVFKSGAPPSPVEAGDVDCSGAVTSSDIVKLVNYVFRSGPAPDC